MEDAEKIKLKLASEAAMPKQYDFSGSSNGRKNDEFDVSEFGLEVETVPAIYSIELLIPGLKKFLD